MAGAIKTSESVSFLYALGNGSGTVDERGDLGDLRDRASMDKIYRDNVEALYSTVATLEAAPNVTFGERVTQLLGQLDHQALPFR